MGKSAIENQMIKIFKHVRQNSYGTRARYKGSCASFVLYLSNKFKVQNIRNIQDKHVVDYIRDRQKLGIAAKTIKNDLGAIRYMHDQISNAKYELSTNQGLKKKYGLELDKTPHINGDRSWTHEEYEQMQRIAEQLGRADVRDVMKLCRSMGLRITEAVAVSRAQAERAIRTGVYEVKGEAKNGKLRDVPLSHEAEKVFKIRLKSTGRGHRLFVPSDKKTHEVVNQLEKFLGHHRDKAITVEGMQRRTYKRDGEVHVNDLTFHGLRYAYVQDRMEQEMSRGLSMEQAAVVVTKEVGHERIEVINIYMGGK